MRTSGDADRSALLDPSTSASDLFEIAGRRPDLGALVAEHPNVYADLLEWLAEYGDDTARDAVTRRRAAYASGAADADATTAPGRAASAGIDLTKPTSSSAVPANAPDDAWTDATVLKSASGAVGGGLGVALAKPVDAAGAAGLIDRVPGAAFEEAPPTPLSSGPDVSAPPMPDNPSPSGRDAPSSASPFEVDSPPPPPDAPARAGLLSKSWAVVAAAVLAFAVAAVASGAVWSLAAGSSTTGGPAGAPIGPDGKPVRTAMPLEQVQEQVEDGDLEGAASTASAPAAAGGAAAGGKPAVTQPSRDTVMQNLLSAAVPSDCNKMTGNLKNGVLDNPAGGYGYVKLRWLSTEITHDPSTPETDVAWGDVTGDGVDDIAVRMACWPGGVSWPDLIAVYRVGPDGSLSLVGGRNPLEFDGVTIGNSRGTVTYPPRYADGQFVLDGALDTKGGTSAAESMPDTVYTATFAVRDDELTQTGITSRPL